jgi:hypothetical protein
MNKNIDLKLELKVLKDNEETIEENFEKIPKSPLLNEKSQLILSKIFSPYAFDIGGTMTKLVYLGFLFF